MLLSSRRPLRERCALQQTDGAVLCLLDGTLAQEGEVDGARHDFQGVVDRDDGPL